MEKLPQDLLEGVLSRLGFQSLPEPTYPDLAAIYAAWCQKVPFDNVRKLIHARAADPGPFPGSDAEDYFTAWLAHGTGGTCWAGAGAMQAFLSSLGFDSRRGIATMMAAPGIPPNHGTVLVAIDGANYLMDTGILCGVPLILREDADTVIDHPAWGLSCGKRDGLLHIMWRPLHKTDGFECRLEHFGATHSDYQSLYEDTRGWSPFNYELTARINKGEEVIGASFGQIVTLAADGSVTSRPISSEERVRLLVEDMGFSEEIVSRLPVDIPTPPPPGSKAAELAAAADLN